ncbi:Plant self-incompatibility S1 [Macleaya cordata]|uniref:S-protein homolog n=1 Tax=Macleaya cordata TaxID=56857 RepID=A0A200PVJ0_MACCD|nr:Plant self-incompatibility S1 [Macleaya cordata]OVA02223.1 Plant self-incompatibility S1 [Macleaya cordata]
MGTYNSSYVFILIVLVIVLLESKTVLGGRYHVYVINDLGKNIILYVHCKSKDDDLGKHWLKFGADFNWSFKINHFYTTLFYCDLSWGKTKGHFDIFVAGRDWGECGHENICYWRAKKDGLYRYNAKGEFDERMFKW